MVLWLDGCQNKYIIDQGSKKRNYPRDDSVFFRKFRSKFLCKFMHFAIAYYTI